MTTEAAVVYFLVEVRKLLEHDETKESFAVLNFYCNWVVHTKLETSAIAERIIRLMDDVLAYMVSENDTPASIDELTAHLDQSSLRKELGAFLSQVGLPTTVCDSQAYWNNFQRLLGAVIQDAPLLIHKHGKQRTKRVLNKGRKRPTRYVESVTVENMPLDDGSSLNFKWVPKFHTHPEGKPRLHPGLEPMA